MSEAPLIPIANLYYLFCYAWNRFEEGRALAVGAEDSPDLPNLLAKVLLVGTRSIMRRGLDRGYREHHEDLATVRGRIELNGSIRLKSRQSPRLSCLHDELTQDVLHNQIMKASLSRLARVSVVDRELAHELRVLARSLGNVTDIRLSRQAFRQIRLHRNNAYYDLLLKICRLAFEMMLPTSSGSGYAFQDILRDERRMAGVFEDFVRNFYRTEQSKFDVRPLQLGWHALPLNDSSIRLPSMITDIYLQSDERRIIIDTKYYADALQRYQGSPSYRSENLYQLFAYLRNEAISHEDLAPAEGILLYPQAGEQLDGRFDLHGHLVRLATINLAAPWTAIDGSLRALIT